MGASRWMYDGSTGWDVQWVWAVVNLASGNIELGQFHRYRVVESWGSSPCVPGVESTWIGVK